MDSNETSFLEKLEKKGFVFVGEIREAEVRKIKGIIACAVNRGERITLLIDSDGGEYEEGRWLVDQIEAMGIEATGIAIGKCSSMAIPLLLVCKRRLALRGARFFFHNNSGSFKYKSGESFRSVTKRLRQQMKESRIMQSDYSSFCARRMGVSPQRIMQLIQDGEKENKYIHVKEAKKLGMIHEITEGTVFDVVQIIGSMK